jgi:hypothetical protein
MTGCATKFERQAFNSEASINVKNLVVNQWNDQEEYPVYIVNHPGNSFGLLGAIAAAADRNTKTKKVNDLLEPSKTKVTAAFYEKAVPALKNTGYEITTVPVKRTDKSDDVKASIKKIQGQDANLAIDLFSSYLAAGASTDYFPSVVMLAELTDAKTQAMLYREAYHYGYNNGNKEVVHIDAPAVCKFKDIDALTADMDVTRKCLMDSIDILVKQLTTDLKK